MKGPIPPHALHRAFLPAEEHGALLAWTLASERLFAPSLVDRRGYAPERRTSLSLALRDHAADLAKRLSTRLRAAVPALAESAGMRPFEPSGGLELDLVAYGDGARFHRHRDILRAGEQAESDRVLSAVYYFFREPKAFSGGALRLYRFGVGDPGPGDYALVEPEQNALVAFPAFAEHEVMSVRCPSGRFEDYRFALNCWFHRDR